MGDPSDLRFVPASSSATPIDWTRIPEETKKYLIEQYGYDWDKKKYRPLPATIGDLVKMFDETKFFGYLDARILTVLMDISEFGLQPAPSTHGQTPAGPRFYMKYLEQVWFLLFTPGTRDCIVGYSHDIKNTNDEEKMAADETAMAQAFDVKLEKEVSRGQGTLVKVTKKLGGWAATMSQSSLEYAQYAEAVMMRPGSHPAYTALMENMYRTWGRH